MYNSLPERMSDDEVLKLLPQIHKQLSRDLTSDKVPDIRDYIEDIS